MIIIDSASVSTEAQRHCMLRDRMSGNNALNYILFCLPSTNLVFISRSHVFPPSIEKKACVTIQARASLFQRLARVLQFQHACRDSSLRSFKAKIAKLS